jgi:hypothetical protein
MPQNQHKDLTKALEEISKKAKTSQAGVSPITEATAVELTKQMKRLADLMERQQKIDMITGTREKIQEAIETHKAGR